MLVVQAKCLLYPQNQSVLFPWWWHNMMSHLTLVTMLNDKFFYCRSFYRWGNQGPENLAYLASQGLVSSLQPKSVHPFLPHSFFSTRKQKVKWGNQWSQIRLRFSGHSQEPRKVSPLSWNQGPQRSRPAGESMAALLTVSSWDSTGLEKIIAGRTGKDPWYWAEPRAIQ